MGYPSPSKERESSMPLYEYECECGKKFETLRSIEDRYNVSCECGKEPVLKVSAWGRVLVAGTFTVVGHDGTILSKTQTTERTPIMIDSVGREY